MHHVDGVLQVREVKVSNGAGFIVALTGKMMLMPGMPRESAVQRIDIDSEGRNHRTVLI